MHAPQPVRSPAASRRIAGAASMGLLAVLLLGAASSEAQAQAQVQAQQAGFERPDWAVDAADLEPDLSAVEDIETAPLVSQVRDEGEPTQGGAAFIPFDLSGRTVDEDAAGSRGDEASLFQSAVMMLAAMAGIGWILRLWWRTQ